MSGILSPDSHDAAQTSRRIFCIAWLVLTNGAIGCATMSPPASPAASGVAGSTPAATPTIWDFLGVTNPFKCVCAAVNCEVNKLGSLFPGLEPTPAMLAIADPQNANSSNPAVKAAAAAKADEDAAPQKIKALKYLGSLGCGGCYPDIEAALLSALEDCTESVRYEAVKVLAETSRNPCRFCDSSRCCSSKVREKLTKIAYQLNDSQCHVEPSARVRRGARVALANCGCVAPDMTLRTEEGPSMPEDPPPGKAD